MTRNHWALTIFSMAILLLVFAAPFYRMWRRQVSLKWPLTTAQFVSGEVKEHHPPEGGVVYTLQAIYKYSVDGVPYWGEYSESYVIPTEAQQLFRSMKNGPLYVRYNPGKTDDSVLDPYRDIRPDPSSIK